MVDIIFQRLENLEKDEKKRKKENEINSNNNDLFEFYENNKSKDFDYSVSENLKNLVIDKIRILKDKNIAQNKYFSYYTFSHISKFCFSAHKLLLKFRDKLIKEINEEEIVNIVF